MVTGDFNHDGRDDLAVANFLSSPGSSNGEISILLNNGSGGFLPATNISAGGIYPRSIVSADFNHDSKLDLAVVNNDIVTPASAVTILLGDGSGGFAVFGSPLAINAASDLTTGDFNKDGNPDLAATHPEPDGSVSVLLGNGSGEFLSPQIFTVASDPVSIATADFNGDTNPDIVTGNSFNRNVSVLLGDGIGGFGTVINFSTGPSPIKFIDIGDFNRDSKIDVVAASDLNTVAVVLGNGDGTFAAPTQLTVAGNPQSVLVKDLNADGKLDLVTPHNGPGTASVLLGNGLGSFGSPAIYNVGRGPIVAVSSDFNGDLKLDLAFANGFSNSVSILLGDGLGVFSGTRNYRAGGAGIAGGDFNRDGNPDLVAPGSGGIDVLLGDGSGLFAAGVGYITGLNGAHDATVADFNDDGKLDVGTANFACCGNTDSVAIVLGNGNGGFGSPTSFTAGSSTAAFGIVSADFNKDGKIDLAVLNNADNNVSVLIGDGNGSFAAPVNISLGTAPVDLAAGGINGDGNADLIVVAGGSVYVLLGDGAGGFSVGAPIILPGAISVAIGDVNGDGLADLATANSSDSVSVLPGNGLGGFGAPANLTMTSPSSVALADLNGDGKTDLAIGGESPDLVIRLGDGTGAFGSAAGFTLGSTPNGILPIDLNHDGRLDLAVASNGVSVLLDTCPADPVVPPGLYISDAIVAEGNSWQTNAEFEIFLPVSSDKTVTVSYYSSNESATGGVDYQSVSGRVTFPPGVTERTIVVPVNGDTLTEPEERFNVILSDPLNAVLARPNGLGIITNDDGPAVVAFAPGTYTALEGFPTMDITVIRSVNLSIPFSVRYATSDNAGANACNVNNGAASSRCDYLTTVGTLHFAANETTKHISVPIIDDAYPEGIVNEEFFITLSDPSGATLGPDSTASIRIADNDQSNGTNPLDVSSFFVRQHYLEFLNREPDAVGLFFWTDQIESCSPKPQCTEIKRINVSAAFFLSIEFQETGYLVYRFYKSAYGNIPGTPVPVQLLEFLPDTQQIGKDVVIGQPGAEQTLEANKVAYASDFVLRSRFTGAYPTTLTPAQFVDALFANAGVTPSATDRNAAINEFGGAGNTTDTAARARALRRVAENSTLKQQETNKAFVLMQYFGYLRRNPNDPPELNLDFGGYNFWLGKLNEFNGNFVSAEMVKAFIISGEYRQRFGP